MAKFLNKLQQLARLVSGSQVQSESRASSKLPPVHDVLNEEVVKKLMDMIEHTHEQEYSCEETSALLDSYVEMAASNKQASLLMPLVKRHLDLCVDCRDSYETLLQILQTDSSSPAQS
jgi:hypothetical protein